MTNNAESLFRIDVPRRNRCCLCEKKFEIEEERVWEERKTGPYMTKNQLWPYCFKCWEEKRAIDKAWGERFEMDNVYGRIETAIKGGLK
jgi:hypothetical protein